MFAVAASIFLQAASIYVPTLPMKDFMAACIQSGGDVGWFPPIIGGGTSSYRSVYLHDTQPKLVTVSFYNEAGAGQGTVAWFWPTPTNPNREVTQGTSIPESVTVPSTRVRYAVSGTSVPTAVCTRVR